MLTPLLLLLLLLLVLAAVFDIRTHRIPNKLNLLILILGLSLQTWFLGLDGLTSGLLGLAVGLGMFIPFYLLGGFGAGDVKLMAVVGTFLGPQDTFLAAALTLFVGAVMGLLLLLLKRGFISFVKRHWLTLKTLLFTRKFVFYAPQPGDAAAIRFPYASAVAMGTLSALFWVGLMDLSGIRDLVILWFA